MECGGLIVLSKTCRTLQISMQCCDTGLFSQENSSVNCCLFLIRNKRLISVWLWCLETAVYSLMIDERSYFGLALVLGDGSVQPDDR